jgi:hypothetical protein
VIEKYTNAKKVNNMKTYIAASIVLLGLMVMWCFGVIDAAHIVAGLMVIVPIILVAWLGWKLFQVVVKVAVRN